MEAKDVKSKLRNFAKAGGLRMSQISVGWVPVRNISSNNMRKFIGERTYLN